MPLSDLPHESLLDRLNIPKDSLNASILLAIQQFKALYDDAMRNGVDSDTIEAIREKSEEIAEMIQAGIKKDQDSGKSGLGFLAVLAIVAGTAIGIREITR